MCVGYVIKAIKKASGAMKGAMERQCLVVLAEVDSLNINRPQKINLWKKSLLEDYRAACRLDQ